MKKIWTYQVKEDSKQGFLIQENNESDKKNYTIWHDPYLGGYAYDSDWLLVGKKEHSFDKAYKWIVQNYGEIIEIE
jgi:hypothetical protein